eukprot:scaffold7349_cov173-Amphora_coffeaeformis.AAC.102
MVRDVAAVETKEAMVFVVSTPLKGPRLCLCSHSSFIKTRGPSVRDLARQGHAISATNWNRHPSRKKKKTSKQNFGIE